MRASRRAGADGSMSKTNQRPDAAAATVDQTTSATADETNRRDGLLAPFRFRAGARVLEVGWGTGETTAALARDGADVLVLEPVPELATATRERFDRVSHVSVVEAWFFDWLGSPGARDERFDMLRLQAPCRHVPVAHVLQLVRHEIERALAVALGRVAAVTVAAA